MFLFSLAEVSFNVAHSGVILFPVLFGVSVINEGYEMIYIVLSGVLILSAVICHTAARKRGLRPVLWGVLGLLFGPLAIPFVFLNDSKH